MATLVTAAAQELGGLLDVPACESGMHLVAWLKSGIDDQQAVRCATDHAVAATPLSAYAASSRPPPGLLLGFSAVDAGKIRSGVRRLATALR